MGFGRKHPPSRSGANASLAARASALAPVSPLPPAIPAYVPPGTYGAAPHVPVTAYVPPLPPLVEETGPTAPPLRIVTEDPLAFLAAQTPRRTGADEGGSTPDAPTGRFRPTGAAPRERRGSVAPPGYR